MIVWSLLCYLQSNLIDCGKFSPKLKNNFQGQKRKKEGQILIKLHEQIWEEQKNIWKKRKTYGSCPTPKQMTAASGN